MKPIRVLIVVSTVSLLMPSAIGFAKTSMTLQKLSTIVQMNEQPVEFSLNVEGTYDDYTAQAIVKGVTNSMDSTQPLEGDFSVDASVTLPTGGSVRVLIEGRAVKNNLYIRVNDLTMKKAEELGIDVDDYKNFLNTWIRFPLDNETLNQLSTTEKMKRSSMMKRYEKFIDITETIQANGMHHYAVSIPRAKQRRLLAMLTSQSRKYTTSKQNAEARKNIRSTTITFDAFVDVLSSGQFSASDVEMTVMSKLNGKKAGYTLDATSKTVRRAVIIAPTDSKLLEEIIDNFAPTRQLGDARDAQRRSDVNTILNAVYQYSIDNNGEFPASITTTETEICTSKQGSDCTGLVDLSMLNGYYLVSIPGDPKTATKNSTKYTIVKKATKPKMTVSAPAAEGGVTISVSH